MVSPSRGVVSTRPARKINNADELAVLASVPLMLSLTPEPPLVLAMAELTEAEAKYWETRLNREWNACGCREGEIAFMAAIAAYFAAAAIGIAPAMHSTWGHFGWATLMALAAAAIGKIVGRLRSLLRLRQLTREMRYTVAMRSVPMDVSPSFARAATGAVTSSKIENRHRRRESRAT
jgi:hypothetical protein